MKTSDFYRHLKNSFQPLHNNLKGVYAIDQAPASLDILQAAIFNTEFWFQNCSQSMAIPIFNHSYYTQIVIESWAPKEQFWHSLSTSLEKGSHWFLGNFFYMKHIQLNCWETEL